jgi:hypothetical protein
MQLAASLLTFATLAFTAIAAPVAQVEIIVPPSGPTPNLGDVTIESVNYAGTGCPAGTASVSLSDDKSNVVLAFDSYVASIGPGIAVTESRKNCALNFNIKYPPGWSYTIYETDYLGFVGLDEGVTATQKSTYFFSSKAKNTFEGQSFWTGPISEDYQFTDTFDAAAVVLSPCDSKTNTLNVNTQIRLDNSRAKTGSGLITTDTITGKVTQLLGIAWFACP